MTKKTEKEKIKEEINDSISYWDTLLQNEFNKETDRGAVILAASLFDNALSNLLKTFLVPNPSSSDDLFEGPNSSFGSFSSKISASYRLGLISHQFARDLNLIRRVRNEFAHNIHGCNFEHSGVLSRVQELSKSSKILEKNKDIAERFSNSIRGEFLMICSWMLWSINVSIDNTSPIETCKPEFGYQDEKFFRDIRQDIQEND